MKTQNLKTKIVALALLFCFWSKANIVIVSGFVKNPQGAAIANKLVTVQSDTVVANGTGCFVTHTVLTNSAGFYSDTLNCCVGLIKKVYTSIVNCNGVTIKNTNAAPTTLGVVPSVTSNFTDCVLGTTTCSANFYDSTSGRVIMLINASQSNRTIGSYSWVITAPNNTKTYSSIASPTITVTDTGYYNICLTIRTTDSLCNNTYCRNIRVGGTVVTPPVTSCLASFVDSTTGKVIKLINTSQSSKTIGKYNWVITAPNNTKTYSSLASPTITVADTGYYKVCLTIRNVDSTCTDSVCKFIKIAGSVVTPPVTTCYANFFDSTSGKTIRLINASQSSKTIGSYYWVITAPNNTKTYSSLANPTITVADTGIYNICLTIRTADSSCTNTFCKNIKISSSIVTPPVTTCYSNFFDSTSGKTIRLINASQSSKTIGSYSWVITAPNNTKTYSYVANPTITVADTGIYNICLTIRTADSSCTNTFCKNIKIGSSIVTPPVTTCSAKFADSLVGRNLKLTNKSVSSKAIGFYNWVVTSPTGAKRYSSLASPTFVLTDSGAHNVCLTIVTSDSSCTNTACKSLFVPFTTTSTSVISFNLTSTYPNPVLQKINIDVANIGDNTNMSVMVSDTYGKIVSRSTMNVAKGENSNALDVSKLAKGTYILTILNNKGEKQSKIFNKI